MSKTRMYPTCPHLQLQTDFRGWLFCAHKRIYVTPNCAASNPRHCSDQCTRKPKQDPGLACFPMRF